MQQEAVPALSTAVLNILMPYSLHQFEPLDDNVQREERSGRNITDLPL